MTGMQLLCTVTTTNIMNDSMLEGLVCDIQILLNRSFGKRERAAVLITKSTPILLNQEVDQAASLIYSQVNNSQTARPLLYLSD